MAERAERAVLFDEPLSSLDAALRVELRTEVAALVRRRGVTTLYVAHDQVEAMAMADRIGLLRHWPVSRPGARCPAGGRRPPAAVQDAAAGAACQDGHMVDGPVAFVLGGGGVLGAVEVGMLRALFRAGIRPDLVLGTSIGAVNGALVAADPTEAVTDRLVRLWASPEASEVYGDSVARQLRRFVTRTHLHSPGPLRRLLSGELGADRTFDQLAVPFRCCAANIERAAEHWFSTGPLVDAVLASASVPGLLPPTEIDGQHYVDGGIVNSIPIGEAVQIGARQIFVLQVGRIERPLSPPRRPWEIAQVAFEIARRHRFAREMAALPPDVTVHVLPTGGLDPRDDTPWAYRDMAAVGRRISRAYTASRHYLAAYVVDA